MAGRAAGEARGAAPPVRAADDSTSTLPPSSLSQTGNNSTTSGWAARIGSDLLRVADDLGDDPRAEYARRQATALVSCGRRAVVDCTFCGTMQSVPRHVQCPP